jgi:hypothetical protein
MPRSRLSAKAAPSPTRSSKRRKSTRQRGVVSQADVAAFKAAGYDNRAVLDVLVLAATKLISNYTNHVAETPNDSFMKGAEWTPPGKLKPAA